MKLCIAAKQQDIVWSIALEKNRKLNGKACRAKYTQNQN